MKKNCSYSDFGWILRWSALLLAVICLFLAGCGIQQPGPGRETGPGASAELPGGSSFAVHFIDVGQGDSSLVICDGKAMLIDGGDKSASSVVYTYLKKQGLTYLDYVVCTHPDADHVGGLSGALEQATAGTVFCPVDSYDSQAFNNFKTRVEAQGKTLVKPAADSTFQLGSATVTVLAPRADYKDNNNKSIVLRIVYGNTSFLFTGDAEHDSEAAMCEAGVTRSGITAATPRPPFGFCGRLCPNTQSFPAERTTSTVTRPSRPYPVSARLAQPFTAPTCRATSSARATVERSPSAPRGTAMPRWNPRPTMQPRRRNTPLSAI